jgi:hypothetical protein
MARREARAPGVLRGDHFVADEMEPDHLGSLVILEMTPHRIAHGLAQLLERVGFGDDRRMRFARCSRPERSRRAAHTPPPGPRAWRVSGGLKLHRIGG